MKSLEIVPMDLADANAFVGAVHRHHRPVQGHKFSLGVRSLVGLCGVAIIGRPVARFLDDGWTLEVTRLATDGTPNACSCLYGAARRACFALGFRRLITYILKSESGVSLKAAGFKLLGERGGGTWNRANRNRVDKHPTEPKLLWEST